MFAPRYYARRYFAGRYFPPADGVGGPAYADMALTATATATATLTLEALKRDAITAGGWETRRKRRWRVKTDRGPEFFDTAEAAYERFLQTLGIEPDAPKRAGVRRISLPAIPAQTVTYDGADTTRAFAKVARDITAAREQRAAQAVADMLRAIELDAARRAMERDDDEAAAILLLH